MTKKQLKIIDLFAGVGGFRIGLENSSNIYKTVWSNQWEPSTKSQIASEIYQKRFGNKNHSNKDISKEYEDFVDICKRYSIIKQVNEMAILSMVTKDKYTKQQGGK